MRFALVTGGNRKRRQVFRASYKRMALLPQDPHGGHSFRLQSRFRRPAARKARWRNDWTPVGLVVLLLTLFILLSVFLPRNEAIERVTHAAQNENKGGAQHPPEVVILAEP